MGGVTHVRKGLVAYPFQLRPGVWISIRLPVDFDAADYRRIVAYLDALALPVLDETTKPIVGT